MGQKLVCSKRLSAPGQSAAMAALRLSNALFLALLTQVLADSALQLSSRKMLASQDRDLIGWLGEMPRQGDSGESGMVVLSWDPK